MSNTDIVPNWDKLDWQERREIRFQRWLNAPHKFVSSEAEKLYKERVTRFTKALTLSVLCLFRVIPLP